MSDADFRLDGRRAVVTGAARGIGRAIAERLAVAGAHVVVADREEAEGKARRYGRIVNIASIGGKHGAPEQAHYSASKAAVMGFTRVLAQEVGVDGITANCVCPGIILTDMGRVNLDDPAVKKSWQDKTAMRRIGDPEDVVGAVAFFASDDAAFVTGQTLNVDGGIVLS